MAGLSDLSFDPGVRFASLAKDRFRRPVSPPQDLSPGSFLLVVSFGRSAIRLNEDSVGLILQACLGGVAKDFSVTHLCGWMFSFLVSCKEIGFMIYNLKNFSCKSFSVFFHLWSGGGPNWCRDYAIWCEEQEAEWMMVGSKKKQSYADVARTPARPLKPTVFRRLEYLHSYYQSFMAPPSKNTVTCKVRGTNLKSPSSTSNQSQSHRRTMFFGNRGSSAGAPAPSPPVQSLAQNSNFFLSSRPKAKPNL